MLLNNAKFCNSYETGMWADRRRFDGTVGLEMIRESNDR